MRGGGGRLRRGAYLKPPPSLSFMLRRQQAQLRGGGSLLVSERRQRFLGEQIFPKRIVVVVTLKRPVPSATEASFAGDGICSGKRRRLMATDLH